jgi:hypothetical protein
VRSPWPAALLTLCAIAALGSGCTKRVALSTSEVNIADGREYEVEFKGDRTLRGRLVSGQEVKFVEGDSLFAAEVGEVTDEFIGLTGRELVIDEGKNGDWTALRRSAEDAAATAERPAVGNALLPRDEIESITLIAVDRRRTVVEAIFWSGLAVAAGLAAFAN